ncbi:signal peptidase II [Epibacterium ulvae]|uniref:signal peptidase II n=1 Tax=Epibacterium ulvae TaxID=1156985 RepID=UPI002491F184|nr:signal peptidase II [Epibacterium ulvae]
MRVVATAAVLAFGLDQLSKYIVIHAMDLVHLHSIEVFPPLLNFRYGENTGINFGLFDGGEQTGRWVLIGLSLVICAGLLIWARRLPKHFGLLLSVGLVIGGALGNVFDRVIYGYVLDFLNMSCCGFHNPFVFNVADVFIFAGAAGLILFEGRVKKAG